MSAKIIHDIASLDTAMSPERHDNLLAVCNRHQTLTIDSWDTENRLLEYQGDSQNNLVQEADLSFEEEMLDSAFLLCDSEGKGKVSVVQIIDYLKSVTDASCNGSHLQVLYKMFDPDDQGILVDLQTFRTVMTQWIADCCEDRNLRTPLDNTFIRHPEQQYYEDKCYHTEQLGGYSSHMQNMEEQTDLTCKVADLTFTNKKLNDHKIRLEKNLELTEEANTYLTEEIARITCKLKSSQQTVQQTISIRSELEDLKTYAKGLEDKIGVLQRQKKKLEKERLQLSNQMQILKEENDKLLTEKERVKGKLDDTCSANSRLVLQLSEYERLLLQKEDCLSQKNIQAEELHTRIEEYKYLLELKMEKNGSQDQFSHNNEDMSIKTHLSQNQCPSNQPQQSVCKELQEVLELGLPDPLFGISEDTILLNVNMNPEDVCTEIELILAYLKQLANGLHSSLQEFTTFSLSFSQLEQQSSILVQSLRCLMQMKCAWETYASKLNGAPQINTQEELSPLERMRLEESVKNMNMQLVPYQRPNESPHGDSLTEVFLSRLHTEAWRLMLWLRTYGGSSLSIPWIFLLVFLCTFLLLPATLREHIWTVLAGLLWPHLGMQYLDLPPL